MSGLTPPGPPIEPPPAQPPGQSPGQLSGQPYSWELPQVAEADPAEAARATITDAFIVLAWSFGLALVAAFVWWRVTPLAEYTITEQGGSMGEQELARQVSTDGWFFVVALVAGLVTGFVLLLWRRRDPLSMVVLVAVGAVLSTYVMARVGLALGPADPATAFATAKLGDLVPLQLEVQAKGVYAAWGLGALLGSVVAIWGTERR